MAAVLRCQHFLTAVVCLAWFSLVSAFTLVIRRLKRNDPFPLNETRNF